MPEMLYSVDLDACDPTNLELGDLYGLEIVGTTSMGALVRLTAPSKSILFLYINRNWGSVDFAAELVYGDLSRRPFNVWALAR